MISLTDSDVEHVTVQNGRILTLDVGASSVVEVRPGSVGSGRRRALGFARMGAENMNPSDPANESVSGERSWVEEEPEKLARHLSEQAVRVVHLDVAPECTLACRYCFTERGLASRWRHGPHMDVATLLKVVDRCIDLFCSDSPDAGPLTFSYGLSGEPLLHLPEFAELVAHVEGRAADSGRRLRVAMPSTNGTELTPENVQEMSRLVREHAIDLPFVSLDGPEFLHDAERVFPDGTGSYHLVSRQVQHLMELWPVSITSVITATRPYVRQVFEHLHSIGCRTIHMKPVRLPPGVPGAVDGKTVGSIKEGYRDFVGWLLRQDNNRLLDYLSCIYPSDYLMRYVLRLLGRVRLDHRCGAGADEIAVDGKGDIYPCDSLVGMGAFRIGNALRGGVEAELRRGWIEAAYPWSAACRRCWARYLCGGPCQHSGWLESARLGVPNTAECELVRYIIELSMGLVAEVWHRDERLLAALWSGACPRDRQGAPRREDAPGSWSAALTASRRKGSELTDAVPTLRLSSGVHVRGGAVWGGPRDLSASGAISWDAECLYLDLVVMDDYHCPPPQIGRLTMADSIQFGLVTPASQRYEYGAMSVEGSAVLVRTRAPRPLVLYEPLPGRHVVSRVGAETRYSVAVPWEQKLQDLVKPGLRLGFNLLINERDRWEQGRTWMEWRPGMVVERDVGLFGELLLLP